MAGINTFGAVAAGLTLFQQSIESCTAINGLLKTSMSLEADAKKLQLHFSIECRKLVAAKQILFESSALSPDIGIYKQFNSTTREDINDIIEYLQSNL